MTLGRSPDHSWIRRPGRPGLQEQMAPSASWDNSTPPADLWRRALSRGHSGGEVTVLADYALTTMTTILLL